MGRRQLGLAKVAESLGVQRTFLYTFTSKYPISHEALEAAWRYLEPLKKKGMSPAQILGINRNDPNFAAAWGVFCLHRRNIRVIGWGSLLCVISLWKGVEGGAAAIGVSDGGVNGGGDLVRQVRQIHSVRRPRIEKGKGVR